MLVAAVARTGRLSRGSGGSISRFSVSRSRRRRAMMVEETVKKQRFCIARAVTVTPTGSSGTRKRRGRPGTMRGGSGSGGERIDGGLSR